MVVANGFGAAYRQHEGVVAENNMAGARLCACCALRQVQDTENKARPIGKAAEICISIRTSELSTGYTEVGCRTRQFPNIKSSLDYK